MNGLFTKGGRVLSVAAVMVVAVAVGAFAQNGKKKSPGSDLCVAKVLADYEDAQYTTIQAAVNAAKAGQVIEILDTSTYAEQVTIDGRDTSPWPGVTGGKNGITIRYVPVGGAAATWNHPRPTIRYRDQTNTHPRNPAEARLDNEITGAGNFETNGALRVIRAKGVTVEGIEIDGGGAFTFGASGVWCDKNGGNCSPLNHGNSAITLAVASQITVRDCDLKNAFFGINVKDRNTGGVFGNPNKSDLDSTVPLSGFGQVGGHLFEYNKINSNVIGFFSESAWDLGSSVRYNLIYNNKITNVTTWNWVDDGADQHNGGAFMFKDMYLSPIAIYNNTLYDNTGNFIGHWQSGGQHLIFNNIFSKSSPSRNVNHMSLDTKFPNRMNSCVFSVDSSKVQTQCQQNFNCAANSTVAPGGCWVTAIQDGGGIPQTQGTQSNFTDCNNPNGTPQRQNRVDPGYRFDAAHDLRWLQTEGLGAIVPRLFKSLTPTSADFLVPDWDNEIVQQYIKNKGWADAGIRNNDGSLADLGAIPSTGVRQTTVARIMPTNVVLLTGGGASAAANFSLKVSSGTLNNPKIKLLRWIAPIPENNHSKVDDWPSNVQVVPSGSIAKIDNTSTVNIGNNSLTFQTGKTTVPKYGFFEIIVEGTDENGKTVSSDVGFLPYRELQYFLDITVYDGNTAVTTVKAGQSYRIHVDTRCAQGVNPCPKTLSEVEYSLIQNSGAFIRSATGDVPLNSEKNVTFPKDYNGYYFSVAGPETILASGVATVSGNQVIFLGTKDIIIRPGDPAKVVFLDPIPVSQLGTAPAPVINRGVDKEVRVEVQDRLGNAVDVAEPVNIVSNDPKIGDVGAPGAIATKTVTTDKNTGVATFIARVTNGTTGQTFDMTASIAANNASDVGRLRLGRALDRLDVFYSDTAMLGTGTSAKTQYDPDAKIEGNVGEWFKITVRDVIDDTINIAQTDPKVVRVSTEDDRLVFSASAGGDPATEFPLVRGVATFWVTGTDAVSGLCVDVEALVGPGGDVFGGIAPGSRCDITFNKPSSSIERAIVFGDGHGRPDSLLIFYAGEAKLEEATKPSSVMLKWNGVEITASGAALTIRDDFTLHVNLANAALSGGTQKPAGYTSISGQGRGLVTVYGGSGGPETEDDFFEVLDGIGPVLANDVDEAKGGSPTLIENLSPGTKVDTLLITLSEQIREVAKLKGATLLYTKESNPTNEPGASGGLPLNVVEAFLFDGTTYKIVVDPVDGGLAEGNWIRLDPAGGVTDRAAQAGIIEDNKPHAGNRWVQLIMQEVAPTVTDAWYEADPATGKVNFAYVVFDKAINLDTWFTGGSVNFDKAVPINAANLASVFSVSENTLKIDLSVAFESSQKAIRTSSPMSFTLSYAPGKGWGADVVNARDKAAPVLADAVILKIGSLKEDGSATPDTLVVVFSETPDETSLGIPNPVTIYKRGVPNDAGCQPVLKINGPVVPVSGSLYYRATYLIEGDLSAQCNPFPEVGDSVSITAGAGFGDNVNPPDNNNKVVGFNLKQPLKIERDLKWTVKVKSNPFRSGDSRSVGVNLSPSAKGLTNVNVSAKIMVFDNVGALVLDTLVKDGGTEVDWKWEGTNKKGRRVGTGTYLFKAVCEATITSDGGVPDQRMPPYAVTRSLGVVRGKD